MIQHNDDQTYPVINIEEFIGKTVGRRKPPKPFQNKMMNRNAMIRLREYTGGLGIPKGVHRFKSHEEADLWMIRKMAESAAAKD